MEEEKEMSRKEKLTQTSVPVKASLIIMGMGQLLYRQWVKGLVYLTVLVLTCFYMVTTGICDIVGFFTLGTKYIGAKQIAVLWNCIAKITSKAKKISFLFFAASYAKRQVDIAIACRMPFILNVNKPRHIYISKDSGISSELLRIKIQVVQVIYTDVTKIKT